MKTIETTPAIRIEAGHIRETEEKLVEEAPLQIRINRRPYTITMRTPGQDVALTAGLLFTEGILSSKNELLEIQEIAGTKSATREISLTLPESLLQAKNIFNRSIASSASCGICGKTELCDIAIPHIVNSSLQLDSELIPDLFAQMRLHQQTFDQTGGSHAAGLFGINGDLLSIQEDIGRHNAVDKTIGELLLAETLSKAAVLCVSGRVSYEIVAKCVQAQIPFLLSVSAPSSMAVEMCAQKGITLIAFCRGDRATIYTHPEYIELPQPVLA